MPPAPPRAPGRTARRPAPARPPEFRDRDRRFAPRPGCSARARSETGSPSENRTAFSRRFAKARSSWAASASSTHGRSRSMRFLTDRLRARPPQRRRTSRRGRARLGVRLGPTRLESRGVEQLVDQAGRAGAPRRSPGSGRPAPRSVWGAEGRAARHDRGQRRAQVMVGDRAQQERRLDIVAAAQGLEASAASAWISRGRG